MNRNEIESFEQQECDAWSLHTESIQTGVFQLCLFLLALPGTQTKIEVLQVTEKWENGEMNKSAHGDAKLKGERMH